MEPTKDQLPPDVSLDFRMTEENLFCVWYCASNFQKAIGSEDIFIEWLLCIVFLVGSDKGRESILKVRPPSIDQRRACVWSSPDKLSTKLENILKENVSPWDGPKILKSDSQRIVKKMRG